MGGLLISQILTLFTTPVIYLAFDRLARRFSKIRHPRAGGDPEMGTSFAGSGSPPARG
jgi:multidrug efflux pump